MYESFYRLRKTPFRLTPDPYFFFGSRTHQRGAAYLRYAMQQGEGFVVITGAPGTGKTELMLNLVRELDAPRIIFAKIVSTHLNADDFLELVAASFELDTTGLGKGILLKKLENFFIACARQDRQVFLLIDEAHNLSTGSLAELSMLSNFQLGEKAILRCFLLGQESLEKKLEKPELTPLRQRVIASAHLNPMDEAETAEYIKHRLTQAGWRDDPRFHDNAYPPIHQFTGGIPRQINFFCNRLLLQGYIDELHKIDVDVVYGVIKEILGETTVAHAPYGPGGNVFAHRHRPATTPPQKSCTPAPLLTVVTRQVPTATKPEFTSPVTDNPSIGTALIASHARLDDTDILRELTRDGARRLLRTLTQDSQAERELRASVAFYIRAESARLLSPESIQQLNESIPGIPARTNRSLSSGWKWATVASIAVFSVFAAPRLPHIDSPVILSNTAGNMATSRLTVATIAPALTRDAVDDKEGTNRGRQSAVIVPAKKNSIPASDLATTVDSPKGNNLNLATPETPLSDIITETGPSPEQRGAEQYRPPETALPRAEKTENIPVTLANSNHPVSVPPQATKPPLRPSETRLSSKNRKPAGTGKTTDTPTIVFSLPSLPSLVLTKPVMLSTKHVQPSVIGNRVKSATAAETGIPAADLKILLSRLTSAYETGNLRKLVSVFAENARSNDKTSLDEIADDYRKLFDVTDMRRMMISDIHWTNFENRMRGKGNFQLIVRERGAGRVTSYDGSIEFDVAQSTRGIVITQLDYRYDK